MSHEGNAPHDRPTHLLLVRHGESEANRRGVWDGNLDGPLTPLGYRQAELVAARLAAWEPPITCIYSSPLERAQRTAQAIAQRLGLEVITRDDLQEINLGKINGLSMEEFAQQFPDLYTRWQDRHDLSFTWPGGEQRRQFYQRVARAVREIIGRHPGEVVAVVSHGGAIRAAVAGLLGEAGPGWWSYTLENTSITHIVVGPDGAAEMLALGDAAHLASLHEEEDRR